MTLTSHDPPDGWASTILQDVAAINPRGWAQAPNNDELVSFVPMAAVEAGSGRADVSLTRAWADVSKGYTTFQDGDVLFAKITPCMENGKTAAVSGLANGRGAGSTEFHVLRPTEAIDRTYLMHYLLQEKLRGEARANMKGAAGQLRVPVEFMRSVVIPLPPLNEQHRIVAEIETQLTRLDAAVASLERTRANLKRYRAAVLKAACEGRLVPTEAELARVEGREYETHASDEVPDGWHRKTIGTLAHVGTGSTPLRSNAAYYRDGTIPWITSGALNAEYVGEAKEYVTELALKGTNLSVYPAHTLLVAMYGEGKTRGKSSELLIAATTNQAIAAIVLHDGDITHRRYIKLFLGSFYDELRRAASGGVQPNLNLGIIKSIRVPLPPIAEQQRIVAEVERRFSVLDEMEQTVVHGLRRAARLRQAILHKAFTGQLVPQDPDDEPASVLLNRIRAERAASNGKPPRKPRAHQPALPGHE